MAHQTQKDLGVLMKADAAKAKAVFADFVHRSKGFDNLPEIPGVDFDAATGQASVISVDNLIVSKLAACGPWPR